MSLSRVHWLTAGLLVISVGFGSDILLSQSEATGSR